MIPTDKIKSEKKLTLILPEDEIVTRDVERFIGEVKKEDASAFFWNGKHKHFADELYELDVVPLSEQFPENVFKVEVEKGDEVRSISYKNGKVVDL